MAIKYSIIYHPKVKSEDIPKLPKTVKTKIKQIIIERLTFEPAKYSKPLRQSLSGLRKLRIGNYRIVLSVENQTIKIWIIQHRKEIYKNIQKRYP